MFTASVLHFHTLFLVSGCNEILNDQTESTLIIKYKTWAFIKKNNPVLLQDGNCIVLSSRFETLN